MLGLFSVPSSGDYQFLQSIFRLWASAITFPSPHPGIINFFSMESSLLIKIMGFRPLIRGLSISSKKFLILLMRSSVSVPSSGDYQFLLEQVCLKKDGHVVSVPSSGDYQFLLRCHFTEGNDAPVSVPSSGDYQFLLKRLTRFWFVVGFRPLIRGLSISS